MSHISKKKLKKKTYFKIKEQFVNFISGYRNKKELEDFLNEFLTETEKVMLAKRLFLILMIKKGYNFSEIERVLRISPSTVVRFWKKHKVDELNVIQQKIDARKNREKKIKDIDSLIRLGLPPIAGRGRWKFLYENKIIDKS